MSEQAAGVTILAIDPGSAESAYVVIDADTCQTIAADKVPNDHLRRMLRDGLLLTDRVAIEMVASYGMAVGAEVFDTCVWIGRFQEQTCDRRPALVKRHPIKLHHCGSARAKDSNITQALIDRFASGQPNRGKGTKAEPGWFHGFRADIWQAYALAVYAADTIERETETCST